MNIVHESGVEHLQGLGIEGGMARGPAADVGVVSEACYHVVIVEAKAFHPK